MRRGRSGSAKTADEAADKPPIDPYQKALGLLVRREHSRRELKRKLVDRGAGDDQCEAALDRLVEVGYQDDDRFAHALARSRAAAGYGPQRIRAELGMHALTSEQIVAAIDACETDWPMAARNLIERRFPGKHLADPRKRRKAIEFLLRHGFDHSSAFAAVGERRESEDNSVDDTLTESDP